jgi:tetratricopeptide (TPR) repeat protein
MEVMKFASCHHHSKRASAPATAAAPREFAAAPAAALRRHRFPVFVLVPLLLAVLAAAAAPLRAAQLQEDSSKKISQPVMSRYFAERDVEVGTFYLKKGKYDAAISRYSSAINHDPHWAEPYLLLGKAYDKKEEPKRAIVLYRKFLKITPYAKDAKKVQKRIDELTAELKKKNEHSQ